MSVRLRHVDLRRAAEAAEQRCRRERGALHRMLAHLHARAARRSSGMLLGGGVVAGALAARLPLSALLRVAHFLADTALLVRRLPVGLFHRVSTPAATEDAT